MGPAQDGPGVTLVRCSPRTCLKGSCNTEHVAKDSGDLLHCLSSTQSQVLMKNHTAIATSKKLQALASRVTDIPHNGNLLKTTEKNHYCHAATEMRASSRVALLVPFRVQHLLPAHRTKSCTQGGALRSGRGVVNSSVAARTTRTTSVKHMTFIVSMPFSV